MSTRRRDYEVGYGKPPREHQFRKGHSGHRPRKEKPEQSVQDLLRQRLARKMVAKRGGRSEKITTAEALVETLVQSAITGNDANLRYLLKVAERLAPEPAETFSASGKRLVTFELTEEELVQVDAIRDALGRYLVPSLAPEEDEAGA